MSVPVMLSNLFDSRVIAHLVSFLSTIFPFLMIFRYDEDDRARMLRETLGYVPVDVPSDKPYSAKCVDFSRRFTVKFGDAFFSYRRSMQSGSSVPNTDPYFSVRLSTPMGPVLMTYDDENGRFNYYSNGNVSNAILDSVAMYYSLCCNNYSVCCLTRENLKYYAKQKKLCAPTAESDEHLNTTAANVEPEPEPDSDPRLGVFARLKKSGVPKVLFDKPKSSTLAVRAVSLPGIMERGENSESELEVKVEAEADVNAEADVKVEAASRKIGRQNKIGKNGADDLMVGASAAPVMFDDNPPKSNRRIFEKIDAIEKDEKLYLNRFIRKGTVCDYFGVIADRNARDIRQRLDAERRRKQENTMLKSMTHCAELAGGEMSYSDFKRMQEQQLCAT